MADERLRVSHDASYSVAVGLSIFTFARLEWDAVWCIEKMSPGAISAIQDRTAGGIAKELLKLENDDQISQAALYAVKKGLSIEQVERLVLSMNGLLDPFPGMPGVEKKNSGARWVDPNVRAAQTDLERMLGVRVRIRDRKGKGKIVIEYHTVDDYERVVEMLRGKK